MLLYGGQWGLVSDRLNWRVVKSYLPESSMLYTRDDNMLRTVYPKIETPEDINRYQPGGLHAYEELMGCNPVVDYIDHASVYAFPTIPVLQFYMTPFSKINNQPTCLRRTNVLQLLKMHEALYHERCNIVLQYNVDVLDAIEMIEENPLHYQYCLDDDGELALYHH